MPVVLPRAFCCTRTMGAASTRPSLRPLFFRGAKLWDHSGMSCREIAKLRPLFEKLIRCSIEVRRVGKAAAARRLRAHHRSMHATLKRWARRGGMLAGGDIPRRAFAHPTHSSHDSSIDAGDDGELADALVVVGIEERGIVAER